MELAREWIRKGFKTRTILRICNIAPSTFYYKPKPKGDRPTAKQSGRPVPGFSLTFDGKRRSDAYIKRLIQHILNGEGEAYGYHKVTIELRHTYGIRINKKKVYRLLKELGVLLKAWTPRNRHPRQLANNRVVTGSNQLWQMDIKYGYVSGLQRHFYVASIIDVYDREIVGYYAGKTCSANAVAQTLQRALMKRGAFEQGTPVAVRTDNGPQFKSHVFRQLVDKAMIVHERTPNRTPDKNAYIESFHSILERECFTRNFFETYEEAFGVLDRFMDFYNNRRIHMSLYGWPPKKFREKLLRNEVKPLKLAL